MKAYGPDLGLNYEPLSTVSDNLKCMNLFNMTFIGSPSGFMYCGATSIRSNVSGLNVPNRLFMHHREKLRKGEVKRMKEKYLQK